MARRFDLKIQQAELNIELSAEQLRLHKRRNENNDCTIKLTESSSFSTESSITSLKDENDAKMMHSLNKQSTNMEPTTRKPLVNVNADKRKAALRKILAQRSAALKPSTSNKTPPLITASTHEIPTKYTHKQLANSTISTSSGPKFNGISSTQKRKLQDNMPKVGDSQGKKSLKIPSSFHNVTRNHEDKELNTTILTTSRARSKEQSSTPKNSSEEQKALLRKVLAKSKKMRSATAAGERKVSPRSSTTVQKQKQSSDKDINLPKLTVREGQQDLLKSTKQCENTAVGTGQSHRDAMSSKQNPQSEQRPPIHVRSGEETYLCKVESRQNMLIPLRSLGGKSSHSSRRESFPLQRRHVTTLGSSTTFNRIDPSKLRRHASEVGEDGSYSSFISILQKEVRTDHNELWRSFRSVFRERASESRERKKRVKFDKQTTETLRTINLHLKRASAVECRDETQLVTDKKFAREAKKLDGKKSSATQEQELLKQDSISPQEEATISLDSNFKEKYKENQKSDKQFRLQINEQRKEENKLLNADENGETDLLSKQAKLSTPVKSGIRETLSPMSLSGRKRRVESIERVKINSPVPPWANVQLKSRGSEGHVHNNPKDLKIKSEAPQWLNVPLLRSNQRNILLGENTVDHLDIEKFNTKQHAVTFEGDRDENSESAHLNNKIQLQDTAAEVNPNSSDTSLTAPIKQSQRGDEPIKLPGRLEQKKSNNMVPSYVPNTTKGTNDGSAPWAKVKLKQGRSENINEETTNKNPSPPWLDVKLKKREPNQNSLIPSNSGVQSQNNTLPPIEKKVLVEKSESKIKDEKLTEAARDDYYNVDPAAYHGIGIKSELSNTEQIAMQEHLSNVQVEKARRNSSLCPETPLSSKETQNCDVDETPVARPSQSEIKNALSSMLASRQGNNDLRKHNSSIEDLITPTDDEANNVIRLGDNGREITDKEEEKADEMPVAKPSRSEIKNALTSMFASRQGEDIKKSSSTEDLEISKKQTYAQANEYDSIIRLGDKIDFNNMPSDLKRLLQDFILFGLWNAPGGRSEFVVLGCDLLMITQSILAEPHNSSVIWIWQREKIKSINLDMAENVADLTLINESHKVLRFNNAEDCLKFAACFYQAPTPRLSQIPPIGQEQDIISSQPSRDPDIEVEKNMKSASQGEKLSAEEQELLMKYRAVRKSKGINDAIEEAIGVRNLEEENEFSNLSEEDQNAIEKYKKMLKMQIPPEAVQHKMTKNGACQSIIDAVLNKSGADSASNASGHSLPKTNGLTKDEDQVANSYRKMLKVLIPKEAVEHKMKKDGIKQNIINAVLNRSGPTQPSEPKSDAMKPKINLSGEEEKLVATYKKMLKLCVPTEAVRHKMKKDQASSNVILAVFPKEVVSSNNLPLKVAKINTGLTEEEQKRAISYKKMLKMGIPADGVRHKMIKDGANENIVGYVFGDVSNGRKPEDDLSDEESRDVATYKKMLKMHLPEEAVRHKMNKEKASDRVIAAVFGTNNDVEKINQSSRKKPTLKGNNLVALHWTPLSDADLVDNSIWRTKKKRKVAPDAQPGTNDISKLVELFKKKSNTRHGSGNISSNSSKSNEKASLIDLNRANNVAISLKAFKDFTHKQLAETIATLDPQEKISGERVQFFKDLLPNVKEVQAIQAFKGEETRLVAAEIFFKHIVNVQRVEAKVDVMQTMVTFRSNAQGLAKSYNTLERACTQVQNSEKLQNLLDMVLYVGNIMNEGTRTGGAAGFKFDSLLKLTQTKSSDGKTTVLDYLVMIFVAKNMRKTLQLNKDVLDCQEGSRMLLGDMNSETKSTIDGLNRCKTELENLKKENGMIAVSEKIRSPLPTSNLKADFLSAIKARGDDSATKEPPASSSFNPRADLLAAIKARGTEEERTPDQNIAPTRGGAVGSYLEAIKEKKEKNELKGKIPGKLKLDKIKASSFEPKKIVLSTDPTTNDACINKSSIQDQKESKIEDAPAALPEIKRPLTVEGGIERLEQFVLEAEEALTNLKDSKEAAISACRTLAKYCGEKGGEQAASSLLFILSQFASNLDEAVKNYDKKVEMESKKKLREGQSNRRQNVSGSTDTDNLKNKDSKKSKGQSVITTGNSEYSRESQPALDKVSEDLNTQGEGVSNGKKAPEAKDGSSLVLMVNEMLNKASLKTRRNFEKGIIDEDAKDETLKAIYEKERTSNAFQSLNACSNLDLLSSIRSRKVDD